MIGTICQKTGHPERGKVPQGSGMKKKGGYDG